jgi:thiamine-phosphate pyrophosphorylase
LINDRVDYALMSGSDGVHVGPEDLPVPEARQLLGSARIIGATVRSAEGIEAAKRAGADYVGLGPVFGTTSKHVPAPALGIAKLREIAAGSPLPLIAISGINLSNIESVASTGIHGAAVLSDLLNAENLAQRARALAEAFAKGRPT